MRSISSLLVAILLFIVLLLPGCQPVPKGYDDSPVGVQEPEYMLSIVLDVSGSFISELGPGGRGYPFLMNSVDRFFKDRLGSDSKIVITQISGKQRALLWDGTPRDLREQFPDAKSFMRFIVERSNPMGSRVHDSVTESLEYLMGYPGVAQGKSKTACLVLSDFDDNFADEAASKQRLVDCLRRYAKTGGAVGFYWVDAHRVAYWQTQLRTAGVRHFVVVADIAQSPPPLNFE